jgi:hypothetical protein
MKSRVSPYKTDRALGVDLYLKNNLKKNNFFSRKFLGSDNTDEINDSGGFFQLVDICVDKLRPLVGFCTLFLALF